MKLLRSTSAVLLLGSFLLASSASAQMYGTLGDTAPGVPAWLPRGAFLGTYLANGAVTPQGRVQWQLTLIQMRNDAFVGVAEVGGGMAISRPSGDLGDVSWRMLSFYQASAMIGLGYRATYRSNLHWGFHIMSGPMLYGATYDTGPGNDDAREQAWAGIVEGRAQVGLRTGPVTFGVSGGWAQIYNQRVPELSAQYTGGAVFGIFLDWRPLPWE